MNHFIKFLLQLEPELLKEGCGFRYQIILENKSSFELNLFDFTVHHIVIQDTTHQKILSPSWEPPNFYPFFPRKLLPQKSFQMEGELLTYFPLRAENSYELTMQLKYQPQKKTGFLTKNPVLTIPSNTCSFQVPKISSAWHKDLERQALLVIGEQTGHFLKEILVLPLDISSAYTFNIVPVLLPEDQLLILREAQPPSWREELIRVWVETVSPYQKWFKSFHYIDLPEKLLYRLIFSFYAAHEVSPLSPDDQLYFPENWDS